MQTEKEWLNIYLRWNYIFWSHPISVDDSEDKLPSINRNNKETYNEYDFLL